MASMDGKNNRHVKQKRFLFNFSKCFGNTETDDSRLMK